MFSKVYGWLQLFLCLIEWGVRAYCCHICSDVSLMLFCWSNSCESNPPKWSRHEVILCFFFTTDGPSFSWLYFEITNTLHLLFRMHISVSNSFQLKHCNNTTFTMVMCTNVAVMKLGATVNISRFLQGIIEQSTLFSVQWSFRPSLCPLINFPVLFWPKQQHNNINHRSVCSQNEKTKPEATRASVLPSQAHKHTDMHTNNHKSENSLELSAQGPESWYRLFLYILTGREGQTWGVGRSRWEREDKIQSWKNRKRQMRRGSKIWPRTGKERCRREKTYGIK